MYQAAALRVVAMENACELIYIDSSCGCVCGSAGSDAESAGVTNFCSDDIISNKLFCTLKARDPGQGKKRSFPFRDRNKFFNSFKTVDNGGNGEKCVYIGLLL